MIEAKGLSKQYIISHEKDTLIRNMLPYIFRRKYKEEFWALKDVNFSIAERESLGIIGPNGAGKSTLLNIMAGIVTPTEGSVNIKGKVSSILTLGAGFHYELTGEENIFLNGSILGMTSKELKRKLNSIIDFSELGSFVDAPIQTYSTGMMLRLGFSVAVHADFDILLVDEILLVGDLHFQKKCIRKMEEFRKEGRTLVVSSQSLHLVRSLTDKILLLNRGEKTGYGDPDAVIEQYQNLNQS
jgi:ABC-type polysaccharide/polyol phosphate transport system ATPase subunit